MGFLSEREAQSFSCLHRLRLWMLAVGGCSLLACVLGLEDGREMELVFVVEILVEYLRDGAQSERTLPLLHLLIDRGALVVP